MLTSPIRNKKSPLFFGWRVVVGAFLGEMTSTFFGPPALGFFMIPMTQALNIGRAAFTLSFSIRSVAEAATSMVVGPLVDRYGPRMLMVVGSLLTGLVVMSFGLVQAFWQFALVSTLLGIVATAGMGRIVTLVTVSKWFIRKRGRAIGYVTTGFSIGVALAPLSQALISWVEWRLSWVVLGGCVWLLMLPPSFAFMRKSPESMGLRPDGDTKEMSGRVPVTHSADDPVWTLRMAVRTRSLWLLEFACVLATAAVPAVTLHQAPAILDKGFSASITAVAIFIFGIAAGVSKVGFGFLAERIPVQYLFVSCLVGSGGSLLLLVNANSVGMIFAYSVSYGLLRGGFPTLESIIWADYFGRSFLGTIRGVMRPFILFARAGGPLLAGVLFDITHHYNSAFTIFTAMYLIGGLVMLFAPPPRLPALAGKEAA